MKEKYIGQSIVRPDTLAKVTGAAKFTADLAVTRTDLLYAKALYPPYAHAKILSIDVSGAEKAPGVVCVMSFKDLPASQRNAYGADEPDKPILAEEKVCYEGWSRWNTNRCPSMKTLCWCGRCILRRSIRTTWPRETALFLCRSR